MLTERQRDDLRSVAVHESAHGWAAVAFGVPRTLVRLFVDPAGNSFVGRYCLGMPITDPIARTQIGLAGKIGQVLHHRPDIIDGDRLFDMLASGRIPMTESDLRMAGDYGPDDVAACMALVRRQWKRIEITAALLADTVR
jgi:hypothetical protein